MDEIDRIGAELRAEIVRARREDATEPKPYGLHDGPTNRLPDDSTEETVVCLRRFDPVLKQFVFEPLPAPRREDAAGVRERIRRLLKSGHVYLITARDIESLLAALSTAEREREADVAAILREVSELDPTDYPEDDRDTLRTNAHDLEIILRRHLGASADKERLDWLEQTTDHIRLSFPPDTPRCDIVLHSLNVRWQIDAERKQIDNARVPSGGET